MDRSISHITFGIRHRRTFGLLDKVGDIVDHALYDRISPFNTEFFPNYFETNKGGKMVANEETGESFAADADSIVLRLRVVDFTKSYQDLQEIYLPYFKTVFEKFGIENINRIGVVFEHSIKPVPTPVTKMFGGLTQGEIESPNVFSVRFIKKYPSKEAEIKKDVVDYYNTIFTFDAKNDELLAKLDYQAYFDPEYASIQDIDFGEFFTRAEKYLHTKFHSFLTHEKKL